MYVPVTYLEAVGTDFLGVGTLLAWLLARIKAANAIK